jgi:hypothetical protein
VNEPDLLANLMFLENGVLPLHVFFRGSRNQPRAKQFPVRCAINSMGSVPKQSLLWDGLLMQLSQPPMRRQERKSLKPHLLCVNLRNEIQKPYFLSLKANSLRRFLERRYGPPVRRQGDFSSTTE